MVTDKHRTKVLTDAEVDDAVRAAVGSLAAAGHFVRDEMADADLRQALRGELTFDEAIERAAKR